MGRLRGLLPIAQHSGRYGRMIKYARFGGQDDDSDHVREGRSETVERKPQQQLVRTKSFALLIMVLLLAGLVSLLIGPFADSQSKSSCDSVQEGYQCRPEISHYWGQYSPFYAVDSDISSDVPLTCTVTFTQLLSRHGARDPTASKTEKYNATIHKIHTNVQNYTGKYSFLQNYEYTLGADQLTAFGDQEMINSGIKFYQRYRQLASRVTPFFRAGSEERVVESGRYFSQGFHSAKTSDLFRDPAYPYPFVIISESSGSNNTLNHGLCTEFENGTIKNISSQAQKTWAAIFVPPIRARINTELEGAALTVGEVIYLMDQCPFHTVASPTGTLSPFCDLFTEDEWQQYNYYQTLGKYYGYGYGNPLGPTQGVGFANELIARLTNSAVEDETSTNHTLNGNLTTFPLGSQLYADFSHDNIMTSIFSALGLYNGTGPLSNTTMTEAGQANGYSAAYTVPFGARAYFEKLRCLGSFEEQVRVIVNDRVLPLTQCGGDHLGRCSLSKFIDSLGFARGNGNWDQCFT